MKSIPTVHTDRLLLRQLQLSDLENLVKHLNDESISNNLFGIPQPYEEKDAINRMNVVLQGIKNQNRYIYAIVWKETNELIGEIGLNKDVENNKAEVGYWVAKPFRGKGIATEVLGLAIKFGFETLGLQKIYATHFIENPSSAIIMEKHGMIKEAEFKDHCFFKGQYRSYNQYRLTKEEFQSLKHN